MKKIGSFFKLVRWPNLLLTALMMCLVYHCVMLMESTAAFTLLVISMVFIVAGGYVINDIFDKNIDEVNKPNKVIVGKIFTEKQCNIFYWALTIIGLCCALVATIIAYGTRFYMIFACMLLLAAVLYSYSSTYKKKLVIGNLIVSLSVAFAVFLPWLFVMLYMSKHTLLLYASESLMTTSLHIVLFYTAFAFLTTMMREIVKDMEDVKGDSQSRCRTIPVVWGNKVTIIIVILLAAALFCLVAYFESFLKKVTDLQGLIFTLDIVKFGVLMVAICLPIPLQQKFEKPEKFYHSSSIFLKIIMLAGVVSMFFISKI